MRKHNRYAVYLALKRGSVKPGIRRELEAAGMLREYPNFASFQRDLYERVTKSAKNKLRGRALRGGLGVPMSSSSNAIRFVAEGIRVRQGDLVARLRSHAVVDPADYRKEREFHVPASKRYVRPKVFRSPLAARLYANGGRKRRKSLREYFGRGDLAKGILYGELVLSGDRYYATLAIGDKIPRLLLEKKLEIVEGDAVAGELPEGLAGYFRPEEERVANRTVRRLAVNPRDTTVVFVRL